MWRTDTLWFDVANVMSIFGTIVVAAAAGACADRDRDVPNSAAPAAVNSADSNGAALRSAAEEVVSFLAGDADFEALELADTVELRIAPEGGGTSARIARELLRDRSAWRVGTGPNAHSFVPSGLLTKMTTSVGKHMNCQEYSLASRVPALAARPHVGVRLTPPEMRSCLESWNATFVFDTAAGTPRLIAAVYDQWEW